MEIADINKAVPVMLPISDWAALKTQAEQSGRSASSIVRDLVAVHLRGKQPRPRNRLSRQAKARRDGTAPHQP